VSLEFEVVAARGSYFAMREYTVQQGETLEAIVAREGQGISLQAVRDEPANATLLSTRKEDQLRPGDIVRFPDEEGDPPLQVIATGMQHQFVIKSRSTSKTGSSIWAPWVLLTPRPASRHA
jgi:hypothetical protein